MCTHQAAVIRIRDRFVIEVRTPQPDLRSGVPRTDALDIAQIGLVRCKNVVEIAEIIGSDLSRRVSYWNLVL